MVAQGFTMRQVAGADELAGTAGRTTARRWETFEVPSTDAGRWAPAWCVFEQ